MHNCCSGTDIFKCNDSTHTRTMKLGLTGWCSTRSEATSASSDDNKQVETMRVIAAGEITAQRFDRPVAEAALTACLHSSGANWRSIRSNAPLNLITRRTDASRDSQWPVPWLQCLVAPVALSLMCNGDSGREPRAPVCALWAPAQRAQ